MDRISSKIISCVKEYSGHNEIDMNTSLKDDLGLDSLDCTEMLMIMCCVLRCAKQLVIL